MTYFCFFHRVLPKNQFHIDTNQRLKYDKYCVHIDFSTWLLFLGKPQLAHMQASKFAPVTNGTLV